MNKLERDYSATLDEQVESGLIEYYTFENLKLRLACNTWYTPDFMVIDPGGYISFHEAKGIWQDAARVKIKTAAELYPMFRFVAITRIPKKKGGGWKVEEFQSSLSIPDSSAAEQSAQSCATNPSVRPGGADGEDDESRRRIVNG